MVDQRVDQPAHSRNAIGRNPYTPRVLPDDVFVRREIDAVDFIFGDIAVQPLNLRPQLLQGIKRAKRYLSNLGLREASGARNLAFYDVLRHERQCTPSLRNSKKRSPESLRWVMISRSRMDLASFTQRQSALQR